MSVVSDAIGAGGARPPATVKVWDPFVRLFHWSLVASFAVAYATGDEIEKVHVAAGYTIAGLVTVRILWASSVRDTHVSLTSCGRLVRFWPTCAMSCFCGRLVFLVTIRRAEP